MADLTSADLTYTAKNPVNGETVGDSRTRRVYAITTAAGEYPTGGLPLDKGAMGFPTVIETLKIIEPSVADNYQYVYDYANEKIKVIVDDGTSGIPAEHANATFTSPDELIVEVTGY